MSIVDTLRTLFQGERSALVKLSSGERDLRDRHAQLLVDREEVIAAPEPVDIIVANMHACVDRAAAALGDTMRFTLVQAFSTGFDETRGIVRQPDFPHLTTSSGTGAPTFRDLAGLFPGPTKAHLETLIRASTHTSPGPATERAQLLVRLDTEIAAIEQEHSALVDMAAELDPPIVLQLLEPVRTRREQARREAEREARLSESRRDMEIAASQAAAPRRRVSESPYLRDANRPPAV